jgi:cullin 1
LKRLLSPLCLGKVKLLLKFPDDKSISEEDKYTFNYGLVCSSKKISVPFVLQEQVLKKDKIEDNRELAIEAAIVRIMKTRKVLKYSDIIIEVSSSLQMFKPDAKITKKKIE